MILNKLRSPVNQSDIVFLAKRYIQNMPNRIMYEALIDDLEGLTGGRLGLVGGPKMICEYFKKACFAQKQTVEEFISRLRVQTPSVLTL